MEEEKLNKEQLLKHNDTPLFPSGGDKVSPPEVSTQGLIDKAMDAAKQLKEQLDRKEQLVLREQELQARALLSGRAEAGITEKPKSEEELRKEAANKLLAGTGLKI